ncbi:MAG: hypothetical protein WEE64_13420 [Dehalococcoidia bacterium]
MTMYDPARTRNFYDTYAGYEWERLRRELCRAPGLVDTGSHIILAARKPRESTSNS